MTRVRWYHYLIILLALLVVASIDGNPINPAMQNVFFSWVLVAAWLIFTIRIIDQAHYLRQFNSPHNSSFFILGSFLIMFITSAWGNFSTLLNDNLAEGAPSWLHISTWTLVLSIPYMVHVMFSLHSCYRKYFLVYVGPVPVNARRFAAFITILALVLEIVYTIFLFGFSNMIITEGTVIIRYVDPFRWLLIITGLVLGIRYGRQPTLPDITWTVPDRPVQPRPPSPVQPRPPSPVQPRPAVQPVAPATRTTTPSRPEIQRVPPAVQQRVQVRRVHLESGSKVLDELRPKAGILSKEDFKCIFCFNLPTLPSDEKRGIVICPTCRHPAHADEFKEWSRNSSLCSRCDAALPENFRRNPRIIPTRSYLEAMKKFSREMK